MNKDKEMDLLNGKKYNIITFGCQMNEHDSETIAGMLQEKGCVETMSRDDSDITIINTCSVRENADKRLDVYKRQSLKRHTGRFILSYA